MVKEKIFSGGLEGGGERIYGIRNQDGDWVSFSIEGSSFGLDDNDDEVHHSWESESFSSIDEAIQQLSKYWIRYFPTFIHQDFKDAFWEVWSAEIIKRKIEPHNVNDWKEICQKND